MAGNKQGGKKAAKTNKKLYGKDWYARIGAIGGRAKVPKGFALMSPEERAAAGHKGGRKSSRAGILNGQGKPKTEFKVFNSQRHVYVRHKIAKTEKILVKGA